MKKLVILSFMLLVVSCANQETTELPESIKGLDNLSVFSLDDTPEKEVEFSREQVFPGSEDVLIGSLMDFDVDDQGRVFIYDSQQLTVFVFDTDGNLVTSLGREGQGPGEFQDMTAVAANSTHLYTFDDRLKRINVFSLDSLSHSHAFTVQSGTVYSSDGLFSTLFRLYAGDDHPLIALYFHISIEAISPDSMEYRYHTINDDGELAPEVIFQGPGLDFLVSEVDGDQALLSPGFSRSRLTSFSESGMIYTAWSDEYLIKVYDSDGNYLRAIYYPFEKSELDQEDFLQQLDESSALIPYYQNADFPDTWPALHYLFMDDEQRLWVSTIGDDEDTYDWWILSNDGELLATFRWPGERLNRAAIYPDVIKVKDGYLYVREGSSASGYQIVRYRIEETG